MDNGIDLAFAPIAGISASLRERELSPVALVEHCLARIDELNPALNTFITVTHALARDHAHKAETEIRAGRFRGALQGVPVAVKDFYDTAGIRTTAAFEHFESRVPSRDAAMVTRLREAGAVLVGKTNMHKLGMGTTSLDSHFGPVVNPWSRRHVAGGSSGGSAAAVAAGLCFATVDTDAVGSGRLPAASCGVTCLKPTFGLLSTEGILSGEAVDPAILLLSHACVMARSAADVSLVFEALVQIEQGASPAVRRIGVVANFAADGTTKRAFESVVVEIAKMGLETRTLDAPFSAASFDISRIERDRGAINELLFADVDAIVLPTLAAPTPTVDDARTRGNMAVSADNTFFCNYFGLPAVTVPWGVDGNGLPLGVQFVGPQHADRRVLALARSFQHAACPRYSPPERFR